MSACLRAVEDPSTDVAADLLRQGASGAFISLIALGSTVLLLSTAITLAQGGFYIASKMAKPDLKKLNLLQGVKRMFGAQAWWELAKMLIKTVLVSGLVWQTVSALMPMLGGLVPLSAAIEIKVLAAKAVKDGLDKDPDFQRRAAFLQERALHGEVVEKEVIGKITDQEVRARYDKEIAARPAVNEVHARHILVKTKEEAEAIIKQLNDGADFQKLANEHTTDPSGKSNGGDLGYFGPGQMVPEFEKAAMALEPGSYTKEPVQTQFGWHVIKVEDKRPQQPPPFDQVKDQARSAVMRDKYFALVKEARADAKVEIPDEKLKKAVDAAEGGGQQQ